MKRILLNFILCAIFISCAKKSDPAPSNNLNEEPKCRPTSFSSTYVVCYQNYNVLSTFTYTGSSKFTYNKSNKLFTTGLIGANELITFDSLVSDSLNNSLKIKYIASYNAACCNKSIKTINSNLIKEYYMAGDSGIITTSDNIIKYEVFRNNKTVSVTTTTTDGINIIGYSKTDYLSNGLKNKSEKHIFKNYDNNFSPFYLILKNTPELLKILNISTNNYSEELITHHDHVYSIITNASIKFFYEYTPDGLVSRIKRTSFVSFIGFGNEGENTLTMDFVYDNCN